MGVKRSDVGCWVLRCNPDEKWDFWQAEIENPERRGAAIRSDWSLGHTYKNQLIEMGDLMALYIGGQKSPCIVHIGTISSDVFEDVWDPKYIVDTRERGAIKPFVEYEGVVLTQPISRSDLREDAVLGQSDFVRTRMAPNPLHLTREETVALAARVSDTDLTTAGWTVGLSQLRRRS